MRGIRPIGGRRCRRKVRRDWEILPQEAGPGEVILSKRNELGLLSNFAATPFEFRGKRYASLEGFWQMMKYPEGPDDRAGQVSDGIEWRHTRDEVAADDGVGRQAGRRRGRRHHARRWASIGSRSKASRWSIVPAEPGEHYDLIVEATREKVRQNPEVKRVLLATGDLVLKPDHHQGSQSAGGVAVLSRF